jgi:small subunit ribosomal protein S10
MPGVGMRVTTWDRVPLGIGALNLEALDTLENLMAEAPSDIKVLGQQIVTAEASV